MKNRLTSHLLSGLAAAAFFAMPALAQDAAPATTEAANAAAEQPATEEAKPTVEEAQPAAKQPKAEETVAAEQTEAPVAEQAQATEEKPAEQTAAAQPAEEPKAEEAKPEQPAEQAAAPAENTNPGEVADAAGNALDMLKASMNEGTSEAQMQVKYNGEVEFDAYTGNVWVEDDLNHSYASTFDLNFEIQFNEKWSAFVGLEADDETTDPPAVYNGAYIQYQPAEFFAVKAGDLTYSEGAFVAYYDYDDPADNAAGMKEHDIRGLEIDLAGFVLGFGFGRGDNDWADNEGAKVYNVHAAYEFDYAGQHLRPYVDYKSFQTTQHNELHAGVEAGLSLGGFGFRAVYGFHGDYLMDDGDVAKGQDWTSTAHTFKTPAISTTAKFPNTSSPMPSPLSSLPNLSSWAFLWNTTPTRWMMTTRRPPREICGGRTASLTTGGEPCAHGRELNPNIGWAVHSAVAPGQGRAVLPRPPPPSCASGRAYIKH